MVPQQKPTFKALLDEQFARIGKALANAHRLELLDPLAQGERTVEALAAETGLSVANASQHLQTLRAARLVETRRAGVSIYYRLASQAVEHPWFALREAGETHLAEVEHLVTTFVEDRSALTPISVEELREALAADMKLSKRMTRRPSPTSRCRSICRWSPSAQRARRARLPPNSWRVEACRLIHSKVG